VHSVAEAQDSVVGQRGATPPLRPLTVLDAYAVLAYLRGERAASEVKPILAGDSVLTGLGVAQVIDQLVRLAGADEEDATLDLAELGLIDGLAVDGTLGAAAGRLRARRYRRSRCPVSLADCVAAEVARARGRPLATSDRPLLDVCRTERVAVTVLTASAQTGPVVQATGTLRPATPPGRSRCR
jgi:PIN domain nuclease of toxin-antitoxin system